ncbi:MAG: secretin N-terminal domain-containing protein [Betaproteobacteria bacterium]|nr:secretin N-terminal domain-containing protein [Betaproteobacteria bacterium]
MDPAITGEVDKALAGPGPQQVQVPRQGLLPPLRMEMPSVEGRPIDPRFDLSVSNAPAAQVFMAIASGTRYSMLLNPGVTGMITVNLKDVTVHEALDSLRELYGYDFRFDGSRIFVQPAGLQTKIYRVNYLLGLRRGTSELRVQSGSLADSASPSSPPAPSSTTSPLPAAGGAARSMDSTRVTTSIVNDFWGDLRSALTAIVGTGEGRGVVVTPQSGVVLVRAFPTELRAVENYLHQTRLVVERQVMLEAKVIEVTLAEGFQAGINWGLFRTHDSPRGSIGQIGNNSTLGSNASTATLSSQGLTVNPAAGTLASAATLAGNGGAVFGLAFQTSNFAALLQFLDSQGTTQVLSSPRIATLNNQKAVLKVGTDEFFVTNVATVTTTTGTTSQQTPTVTVAPFFSGIMLDVTPQIDQLNNITLHIHPSISEVTESRRVVDLGGSIPSITLPLAKSAVNESDTVVRVTDGNIVAIGGLMSVDVRDGRTGIPGVADANVLLRNSDRQARKREIVILLKPTIIQNDASWGQDLRDTRERLERFIPQRPAQEASPR